MNCTTRFWNKHPNGSASLGITNRVICTVMATVAGKPIPDLIVPSPPARMPPAHAYLPA